MMEISEQQRRRAINIIWNAARSHSFSPDFKAFDKSGQADLYWNCIIGAVRRDYEYPKLEKLFLSLQQYEESDTYEGLLWLGLENAVYQKELKERPALLGLRKGYAEELTRELSGIDDYHLYDALACAHYRRVLGLPENISKYDIKLLDELEFSPELTTDEIIIKASELFRRWFQITAKEKHERREKDLFGFKKRHERKKGRGRYRKFGIGIADHPDNLYSGSPDTEVQPHEEALSKLSESELYEYMEVKFGRGVFSLGELREIERSVCRGNHKGCRLHFTKGESINGGRIKNGFASLDKQREAKQIQLNRDFYKDNIAQNRTSVAKLTERIQNSVLLHLQPVAVKTNAGALDAKLAWRAAVLEDNRVFTKNDQDNAGDFSVDILLDASVSQKERQATVSTQGYIIAESLTRCSIPCRVMSFCSMTGYTVMRIYRDYNENSCNAKIFEYVSNGCNRDGLAISAAHYLMNKTGYSHKMLIILSDVKPNDSKKLADKTTGEYIWYTGDAGVIDTAYEVRRARGDGISVICVFTGEDRNQPDAKLIYGRELARIQTLDKLADTVGMLIQNQIKNF